MELEPSATRILRSSKSTTNDRHRSSIVDDLVSDKGLALLATPLASGRNSGHDGARFTVAAKDRPPPGVARVPGFEPGAYRLGGGRSIQLSYTR